MKALAHYKGSEEDFDNTGKLAVKQMYATTAYNGNSSYTSPYLTCEACNSLVYVDAIKLRSRICIGKLKRNGATDLDTIPPEPLPPCPECNRTTSFRVGADDLTLSLATSAEELELKKQAQKRMILRLQKAYRQYLARQFGRAQRHAITIRKMIEFKCATAIQTLLRAGMAKRRFKVEQALEVIKNARPMLMERALNGKIHKKRVFWYKSEEELDVLYTNYYTLVERMGFHPTLFEVEENINVIAKRIVDREAEIVTRVQSRWRGVNVRYFYGIFLREVRRIREIKVSYILQIQRVFRGWRGRRLLRKLKLCRRKEILMIEYKQKRELQKAKEDLALLKWKVKQHYKKERAEERSARFMGYVDAKRYNGDKMKAFLESPCGNSSGLTLTSKLLSKSAEFRGKQIVRGTTERREGGKIRFCRTAEVGTECKKIEALKKYNLKRARNSINLPPT